MKIFVDYLFAVFPLRKLTAEVIDFNWIQFSSGSGRMFNEEGVLRSHEYHDGKYWDVHLLAIHREQWETYYSRPGLERIGLHSEDSDREEPPEFDAFVAQLRTELSWPIHPMTVSTRLVEDIGCDSAAYVEILLALEELIGKELSEDALAAVHTLGDVYHLCCLFGWNEPVSYPVPGANGSHATANRRI